MATSHVVGSENIGLEGPCHFHVFGVKAAIKGSIKAIKKLGIFIQTRESVSADIEVLIAQDLKNHQVEAIHHVLVGPYEACLLFLDGRISGEHVSNTVDNGREITLSGVKFLADGEMRGFKVVIRNGHDGFATMDKNGEVL
jgi:hypothetical protein